jgi:hypothetical protein
MAHRQKWQAGSCGYSEMEAVTTAVVSLTRLQLSQGPQASDPHRYEQKGLQKQPARAHPQVALRLCGCRACPVLPSPLLLLCLHQPRIQRENEWQVHSEQLGVYLPHVPWLLLLGTESNNGVDKQPGGPLASAFPSYHS